MVSCGSWTDQANPLEVLECWRLASVHQVFSTPIQDGQPTYLNAARHLLHSSAKTKNRFVLLRQATNTNSSNNTDVDNLAYQLIQRSINASTVIFKFDTLLSDKAVSYGQCKTQIGPLDSARVLSKPTSTYLVIEVQFSSTDLTKKALEQE
jgi:hypothetical protein